MTLLLLKTKIFKSAVNCFDVAIQRDLYVPFFKLELKVIANTSQKIEYILVDHSLYINKRLSYNLVNIKNLVMR